MKYDGGSVGEPKFEMFYCSFEEFIDVLEYQWLMHVFHDMGADIWSNDEEDRFTELVDLNHVKVGSFRLSYHQNLIEIVP